MWFRSWPYARAYGCGRDFTREVTPKREGTIMGTLGTYGRTTIDYDTGRVSWYGTGIADMFAARRYLRRKFCPADRSQPVVSRPGSRFYVTARFGGRTAYLLGPYVSHMSALDALPRAGRMVRAQFNGAFDVALGTASRPDTVPTRYGR